MDSTVEDISTISTQIARSNSPDERTRLNARLKELLAKMPRRGRTAEFSTEDEERPTKRLDIRKLYERAAKTDEEREAAKILDNSVMLGALFGESQPHQHEVLATDDGRQPVVVLGDDGAYIVSKGPIGVFRKRDWDNYFGLGMRYLFTSPRDVHRYLNALPVNLRLIGDEVSLADALALEAVRPTTSTRSRAPSSC